MAILGKETIEDVNVNESGLNPDPAEAIRPATDSEENKPEEPKNEQDEPEEGPKPPRTVK